MDLAKKLRRRGNSLKRRKERLALERQGHEEIRATLESTRQHLDNILDELKTAQEEILGHKTKLDEISHLLTKDKLTGILNSNAATEEIHKVYKNAQRAAEARKQKATAKGKEEDSITFMVTVFYDIDRFKLYNDRLGYFACGNTVIKGVAEALQSALRTEDFLFRNGGEEFVSYFHLPIKKHHLKKIMTDHSVSEEEAASMISSDIVKHSVNAVREKTFHIKNATVHEDWKLGKGDRIPANVLFPDGTEAKKGSVIQTESFVIPAGSRFADGIDVCVTMSVGVASARLDQWPNNMPEFSSNMTGIIGDTISRAAEREKISKEEGRDRITPNMGHEASVPAHGLSPLRPYEAKPLIPLATIPVALAAPS